MLQKVDFVVVEGRAPILLVEAKRGDQEVDRGLKYLRARFPKAEAWQVSETGTKDYVTPEVVAWFRAAGRPTWVWTVDDPAEALRFAAMGVESITTNDPAGTLAALAEAGFRGSPRHARG